MKGEYDPDDDSSMDEDEDEDEELDNDEQTTAEVCEEIANSEAMDDATAEALEEGAAAEAPGAQWTKVTGKQKAGKKAEQKKIAENAIKASSSNNNNNNGNNNKTAAKKIKVGNRAPIIKMYGVNPKEFTKNLFSVLGHKLFTLDVVNKNLTILKVVTVDDHAKARKYLEEEKVSFFTYTAAESKPYSLMLRGLSHTYETEDVVEFF